MQPNHSNLQLPQQYFHNTTGQYFGLTPMQHSFMVPSQYLVGQNGELYLVGQPQPQPTQLIMPVQNSPMVLIPQNPQLMCYPNMYPSAGQQVYPSMRYQQPPPSFYTKSDIDAPLMTSTPVKHNHLMLARARSLATLRFDDEDIADISKIPMDRNNFNEPPHFKHKNKKNVRWGQQAIPRRLFDPENNNLMQSRIVSGSVGCIASSVADGQANRRKSVVGTAECSAPTDRQPNRRRTMVGYPARSAMNLHH